MTSDDRVARYYDSNTRRFLLVGGGKGTYAIHRELWGPGVASVTQAADHINQLLAREIRDLVRPAPLILDMGCGVGGTVLRLAEILPESRLHGITISPRQYELAERLAEERGLQARCTFTLGDFQVAHLSLEADAIVAVEAFVHSQALEDFFRNATRHLRQGGHLILVDDFLSTDTQHMAERHVRLVQDFKTGWRVPSVCSVDACLSVARSCGLVPAKDVDLTSLIRPGRARDRLIAVLSPLFRAAGLMGLPFFGNMIGGNALQTGIREGFLQYHMLVLTRASPGVGV